MNDDRQAGREGEGFEPWLHELRATYHRPPPVPVEEIWQEVRTRLPVVAGAAGDAGPVEGASAEGARTRSSPRRGGDLSPWQGRGGGTPWMGAAAALLVGVAVGQVATGLPESVGDGAAESESAESVAVPGSDVGSGSLTGLEVGWSEAAVRRVVLNHLVEAQGLFALLEGRTSGGEGFTETVRDLGTQLLAETRLLLSSPAADEAGTRELLLDVELILAQVATLPDPGTAGAERSASEFRLIASGLTRSGVLDRIETMLPARTLVDEGLE